MTESELPILALNSWLKKIKYTRYIQKNYATDVREDRIPILSSFDISDNTNMTGSKLPILALKKNWFKWK